MTCLISGDVAVGGNATVPIVLQPTGPGPYVTNTTASSPGEPNTSNNGPVSSTVTVLRTCAVYNSTGGPYDCPDGYSWKNGTDTPGLNACCVSASNIVFAIEQIPL